MNDKRNGQAFFNQHAKLDSALQRQQAEIEKTKQAIIIEEGKIAYCKNTLEDIHPAIIKLLEEGKVTQWRKHPTMFFVVGVEKGRFIYKNGQLLNKFYTSIPTVEQKAIFKEVYQALQAEIKS